jgi:hypothetical protein
MLTGNQSILVRALFGGTGLLAVAAIASLATLAVSSKGNSAVLKNMPAADADVQPAETIVSRLIYQAQRALSCSVLCTAHFSAVPVKRRLELKSASCSLRLSSGAPFLIYLSYNLTATSIFQQDLGLLWQRSSATLGNLYSFGLQTTLFVPAGQQPTVNYLGGTPADSSCQIFGEMVTLK